MTLESLHLLFCHFDQPVAASLHPILNSNMPNNHASSEDMPLEKDFSNHGALNGTGTGQGLNSYDVGQGGQQMGNDGHSDNALGRIRTAGSMSISPELFEKLYLSPENRVKGDLRKTFGNPTPL